jgi:hypothetical protein
MAFWSKKSTARPETKGENPYRAIDPAAFDRGAAINKVADQLRHVASDSLQGSDVVAAIQTALGAEIATMIAQRNPNAGPESLRYIMDQVLDGIPDGLREAVYMTANLPPPGPYGDRELTEQEFSELTNRIVNAATWGNVPVTEAMTATAKALGSILCIVGQRPGVDADKLIAFCQDAIGKFAQEAIASSQRNR